MVLASNFPSVPAESWDELWGFFLGCIVPMPIGCNQWSLLSSLANELSSAVTEFCSWRSIDCESTDGSGLVQRLGHSPLDELREDDLVP
jgi:hypothetical protein